MTIFTQKRIKRWGPKGLFVSLAILVVFFWGIIPRFSYERIVNIISLKNKVNSAEAIKKKYQVDGVSLVLPAENENEVRVAIGEKNGKNFEPVLNLEKWDGEASIKLRSNFFESEGNTAVDMKDDKIEFDMSKSNFQLYELESSEELPNGGYEFEITLKEKPETNKVEFRLDTKGLDFFYQSELSKEEKEEGRVRPENVIGSYAVYYEGGIKGDYSQSGGKDYKAGKFGHIFRPKIYDSVGKWVWGDLKIDEGAGVLSVAIPQEFLDNAVYPVKHAAGLTFGNTNIGGSTYDGAINSDIDAYVGTPVSSGTVDSIHIYSRRITAGTTNWKGLVIQGDGIETILTNGITPAGVMNSTTAQWWVNTYSTKPSVNAGMEYYIGWIGDGDVRFYYDDGGNDNLIDTSNNYTTPTDPTDATYDAYILSYYATYSIVPRSDSVAGVKISSSAAAAGVPGWYSGAYAYKKRISTDHQKVGSTTSVYLNNFPMLVSVIDTDLKHTEFGGKVASTTGGDILFTSADGTTLLNYEIEKYASTTGEFVAWVKIPFLSSTSTIPIYMYLGNASATYLATTTGVWDTNYAGVYHLGDGDNTAANFYQDSTVNNRDGTLTDADGDSTQLAGKMGDSINLNGDADYVGFSHIFGGPADITISAWAYLDAVNLALSLDRAELWNLGDKANIWFDSTGCCGVGSQGMFFDGVADYSIPSTGPTLAGNWHYVAYTYGDTVNSQKFYVDGVAVGSGTVSNSISWTGGTATRLGEHTGGNIAAFDGRIDEARVSNTARSADWILTEYRNQSSPGTFYTYGGLESYDGRVNSSGTTMPAVEVRGGVKFR